MTLRCETIHGERGRGRCWWWLAGEVEDLDRASELLKGCTSPLALPCAPTPRPWPVFFLFCFCFFSFNLHLSVSSSPPCAASSCLEAPPPPTQSWSRSPRQRQTRRCLWGWCTGCCQMRSSWPGAGWSPSPSPEHGLWGERGEADETRTQSDESPKNTGSNKSTISGCGF